MIVRSSPLAIRGQACFNSSFLTSFLNAIGRGLKVDPVTMMRFCMIFKMLIVELKPP